MINKYKTIIDINKQQFKTYTYDDTKIKHQQYKKKLCDFRICIRKKKITKKINIIFENRQEQ